MPTGHRVINHDLRGPVGATINKEISRERNRLNTGALVGEHMRVHHIAARRGAAAVIRLKQYAAHAIDRGHDVVVNRANQWIGDGLRVFADVEWATGNARRQNRLHHNAIGGTGRDRPGIRDCVAVGVR